MMKILHEEIIGRGEHSMNYSVTIWTIVAYVESNMKQNISLDHLVEITGFSLTYLREVYKDKMGTSLSRYILERKIYNSAADLLYSPENATQIALDYGFTSYDTFTRAFKRILGLTPSEFRRRRPFIGRMTLGAGMIGIGNVESEDKRMQDDIKDLNTQDCVVLYGVPKAGYGVYGVTPFPICLKSCANYLGRDVDYDYVMVASGAAFRFVWNTSYWDGGNVDVIFTYDDPMYIFQQGMKAIDCELNMITRTKSTTKEEFVEFMKEEISSGNPCIALGIIGPPEACIITGYKNNGNTLLGWNCFMDFPEYQSVVKKDPCGYFITDQWWENTDTKALFATSKKAHSTFSLKDIVANAIKALTGRMNGSYAKGIMAYDAWAKDLLDENAFPKNAILSTLTERMMCQGDAMDTIADGRMNASIYFQKIAKQYPEVNKELEELSKLFKDTAKEACDMADLLGGWARGNEQVMALAKREVREHMVNLIQKAKENDTKALKLLEELHITLQDLYLPIY